MAIYEDQLLRWAASPSRTQEEKSQNARDRIKAVLERTFKTGSIRVFLQGSYKNHTNVKEESDIDIVIEYQNAYYPGLYFLSDENQKIYWEKVHTPHEYDVIQFKNDVYNALTKEFGSAMVKRRNKCIKVKENTYRTDADVVAVFPHRRLSTPFETEAKGIHFISDLDDVIYNFPEHHHINGNAKNTSTGEKYKDLVRILKNIRYELIDKSLMKEAEINSFLIENMLWNVSDSTFNGLDYREMLRTVIQELYSGLSDFKIFNEYRQVDELRYLFRGQHSPVNAKQFLEKSWNYIGYS